MSRPRSTSQSRTQTTSTPTASSDRDGPPPLRPGRRRGRAPPRGRGGRCGDRHLSRLVHVGDDRQDLVLTRRCRAAAPSRTTLTGRSDASTARVASRTTTSGPISGPSRRSSAVGRTHDPAQRQHAGARHLAHEVAHVVVDGGAEQLVARAALHRLPVAHDQDPVAEAQRLAEVVGDEDHRLADLAVQADDLVLHVAADERVERRERLVEEQHVGVAGQRPGEADALLHAARQLVGVGAPRSRTARRGRRPPAPGAAARPCRCRRSRGRRRRCRAPGGAAAGRSAGTPWRRSCGAARAGAARRRPAGPRPRAAPDPEVGSTSRVRQRTSVDLPEPDSPMTTKTSPGATSKLTSRTAAVQPRCSISSRRDSAQAAASLRHRRRLGPKTFHRSRTEIAGSCDRRRRRPLGAVRRGGRRSGRGSPGLSTARGASAAVRRRPARGRPVRRPEHAGLSSSGHRPAVRGTHGTCCV